MHTPCMKPASSTRDCKPSAPEANSQSASAAVDSLSGERSKLKFKSVPRSERVQKRGSLRGKLYGVVVVLNF